MTNYISLSVTRRSNLMIMPVRIAKNWSRLSQKLSINTTHFLVLESIQIIRNAWYKRQAYPRIIQLSVKKKSGASVVKIDRFKNGTAPRNIARICRKQEHIN
jgi:hypothetical protein